MAVDVVVVNYKTDDLLLDFIASYRKHAFEGCRLTVVDVCGGGRNWAIEEGVDLSYLPSGNIGYGRACNWAAMYGENPVILLANADTLLTDGFKECCDVLLDHHDWGVLGPRQVDEINQIKAGGIFGNPDDRCPSQRGWDAQDMGQFSDIREDALSVSGSLYFVKRVVWEELTRCQPFQEVQPGSYGAFLETPHYFEEMFCSLHARAHGYKCVYYGPVKMIHLWHKASAHGGWADQQFAQSQEMHRQACARHGILSE